MRECAKSKTVRFLLVVLIWFFATAAAVLVQAQPRTDSRAKGNAARPAQTNASDYVGVDTCKTCHPAEYDAYMKTSMGQTATDESLPVSQRGCEGCHGAGAAHVQDPVGHPEFNFKTASPSEKAARCLSCHVKDHDRSHFKSTEHSLMGVSCDECHDPHMILAEPGQRVEPALAQSKFFDVPSKGEQNRWLNDHLLKKRQPDLCFGCHKSIQASFALPTHHRVPEGFMKCTDCHNPHGNENRALLKNASWEACVGCHTEKRGPWVFEHPSVRVEGCVACHNPHGSINRNLLIRGEARFLCLQCHVEFASGPEAANVPHGHVGYQTSGDCVRCHVAIHGSNSSDFFLY